MLGLGAEQYLDRTQEALMMRDFMSGLGKAGIFGDYIDGETTILPFVTNGENRRQRATMNSQTQISETIRMDGFGGLYRHTQETIIPRLVATYKDDAVSKWPKFVPPAAPSGLVAQAKITAWELGNWNEELERLLADTGELRS